YRSACPALLSWRSSSANSASTKTAMWSWCRRACTPLTSAQPRGSTGRSRSQGLDRFRFSTGGRGAGTPAPRGPREAGAATPPPKIFTAKINPGIIAATLDVERVARDGDATLVDARPPSFFLGHDKAPAVQSYGHITHAVNLDNATFYDAGTNRLRPAAK